MNEDVAPPQHRVTRREEEVQFRLLVENVQDVAIFLMDPEGRITSWNSAAERIKGWTTEEVLGQHYRLLFCPADRESGKPEAQLVHARDMGKYEETAWRCRKDGTRFWAHLVLTPLYDDEGNLHGFAKITQDRTGERGYVERLHTQSTLTEAIAHHAAEAIFMIDRDGCATFANEAAERMFGWTLEELRRRPLHEVLHHRHADGTSFPISQCPLGHVFRTGTTLQNHEDLFIHKQGHWVPVLCSNAPILEEGEVTAAVLVVHDLTERRRAEEALRTSEQRFGTVFHGAPVGMAVVNLEGRLVESNLALQELLGYGAEELRGKPAAELTHPDDLDADVVLFQELLERKRDRYQLEKRYVRKNGEVLWGRLTAGVARDPSGHPHFAVGMVEDITVQRQVEEERARRERAAQEQQEWLEDVLHLTPTPLLLIQPGTARVLFANRAADRMAGGEFPRGKPVEEYHTLYYCTDAAGRRLADEEMPGARVARGERLEAYEMDWHLPDGIRSLLVFGDTLPSLHGHPATCVVQFNDVTHLKQVEAELRDANQRKDEFLAMLAHELRNPLGAIRNAVALLQQAPPDSPPFQRGLEVAQRQIRHQSRMVDDLLDLSRISRSKLELRREPVDLAELVRHAVDDFRPDLERRGLQLLLSLPEGPLPVHGDGTRLAQVLGNLLHNAAKFTESGEVRVEVSATEDGLAHPMVTVRVQDTGIGVSPELIPRLFEPFSQADSSLDRSRGGLGLGLALVKGLVEMHGGRVSAFSEGEGRGATFTFTLPLHPELV